MFEEFQQFIDKYKLLNPGQQVLAGVSGGADSVAMLHLLTKSGYRVSVAHVNFRLRGTESDEDEQFVHRLAAKLNVPFYSKQFDTLQFQSEQKISIQMAARELRLQWFLELAHIHQINAIALGHHQDDQVETFFINLFRGAGLKGLKAMEPLNGMFIRPMLFADRIQIINYLNHHQLQYREDSSNISNKYLRNKIRNQLLPLMVELVPEAEKAIKKSTWLLGQNHGLYEELVARVFNELIESKSGQSVVYKTKLFAFDNWQTLLWELLTPFNFAGNQMSSIANAMQNEPGRVFFSETHRLSIDRDTIEIIALDQVNEPETLYLYNESAIAKADFSLTFESLEKSVKFTIDPDPHIAYLDKDMIEFPLAVRTWQYGDRFRPLGLKGSKLLSDYFIDSGLSRHQKEQIRLLCNANGDIMWVIGLRIDHRYRIRPGTKNILKIRHLVD